MANNNKMAYKVKTALRNAKILELIADGWQLSEIAKEMNVAVETVQRRMNHALETISMYPTSLSSEKIGMLRQIEAEKVARASKKVHEGLNLAMEFMNDTKVDIELRIAAIGTLARCAETICKLSDRTAKLFGLDTPTKVITESLQISLQRKEEKVTISFDASVLERPDGDVAGMEIYAGMLEEETVEGSYQGPLQIKDDEAIEINGSNGSKHPEAVKMAADVSGEREGT